MPTIRRRETFSPVLLTSESLAVSDEQKRIIREILEVGASDSKFAAKMYDAIWYVLTGGSAVPPVIASLNPSTVVLGAPSFDIHVMGSGFASGSVIVFAGVEEPTTFVSETELTTLVNMDLWVGPDAVPVSVSNPDGVISDPMMFEFTVGLQTLSAGMGTKNKIGYPDPSPDDLRKKLAAEEHHEKGSE